MSHKLRTLFLSVLLLAGLAAGAQDARAQSTDQSLPTPVLTNEINGKISALDMGDPRLTRHFYAFEGNPGDLLITIDSKNLNGDIDVFTAVTFRPLMKMTLYASSQAPEIARGIYLRAHQILILRVEARTPSDEPGTYHIRFGGTFERFSGGIPVAEATTEAESTPEKVGANRLSSVGATIPRPPAEITETAAAKPSPSPSPEAVTEKPAAETETATKPASNTSRRTTSRPPPRRTTRPAPAPRPTTSAKKTPPVKTESETTKTEPLKPEEEKPAVTEKSPETSPPEKAKSQEILPGARLIVEQKDGTRTDRPMSTVRRVLVEGNMVVIVLKTGRIERIPMSEVTRLAIEPQ